MVFEVNMVVTMPFVVGASSASPASSAKVGVEVWLSVCPAEEMDFNER